MTRNSPAAPHTPEGSAASASVSSPAHALTGDNAPALEAGRSEPHVSRMYNRYCKRGHLRTEETTFPRKVKSRGKTYIVRDCRVCHAMRENKTQKPWTRFQSKSKWSEIRGGRS